MDRKIFKVAQVNTKKHEHRDSYTRIRSDLPPRRKIQDKNNNHRPLFPTQPYRQRTRNMNKEALCVPRSKKRTLWEIETTRKR